MSWCFVAYGVKTWFERADGHVGEASQLQPSPDVSKIRLAPEAADARCSVVMVGGCGYSVDLRSQ